MSIEAIESDGDCWSLVGLCNESSKDSQEALATYQDPGPHSGMSRLVEQERFQIGATSNLRMLNIKEKCREIERIFLSDTFGISHDACYLLMVKKLATIDTSFARAYLNKIKNHRAKVEGLIEIAKPQNPVNARDTLNEAKFGIPLENYTYSEIALEIYEEEKRRGFPEAEATIQNILNEVERVAIKSNDLDDFLKLVVIQQKLQKQEVLDTLTHALELSRTNPLREPPIYFLMSLENLVKYTADFQPSIAAKVIPIMREYCNKVLAGEFDRQELPEDYPKENGIAAWRGLVELEAHFPNLKTQSEEDFKVFTDLVESQKRSHPNKIEDYNFDIYHFADRVAEYNIDLAKKALDHISDPQDYFEIMVKIFKKEAHNEGYDKEKGFAELEGLYKTIIKSHISINVNMFSAAFEHMGLAKAQPFLEALRKEAESELPYPNDLRQFLYGLVLEAELECDCPTLNDTVSTIHMLARANGNYYPTLTESLVCAELSLL
jgi:hypothetical protein